MTRTKKLQLLFICSIPFAWGAMAQSLTTVSEFSISDGASTVLLLGLGFGCLVLGFRRLSKRE
jgi:hypothetical protein